MNVAVTIVSKNYISLARVLAKSFKQHHPDWLFVVLLVDRCDGYLDPETEGGSDFELLELENMNFPDIGKFIYRYSIMELNTAVKPFVLDFLLRERKCEKVAYIDPDIFFFRRFCLVEKALDHADICLVPHLRRPFNDEHKPSDTEILQSGTYNLGFLGLRNTQKTLELLAWWMGKLFLDCIVDIPNGLFVDQKWMDMAPALVNEAFVLRNPGYNVAYWNLHERPISRQNGEWFAGEAPLVFFHYSGYSPFLRREMSKHQSRHNLRFLPETQELFDFYGELLLAAEYEKTSSWPYSYGTLPNGMKVPLSIIRDILQWALRNNIRVPDPLQQTQMFCDFMMTPGALPQISEISAFQHFLLQRRPDVASAFKGARSDPNDEGFWHWVKNSGVREEALGDVLVLRKIEKEVSPVEKLFQLLRKNMRRDVFEAFPDMFFSELAVSHLGEWAILHGQNEGIRTSDDIGQRLFKARMGPAKCLHIYFLRGDLQNAFMQLERAEVANLYRNWLLSQRFNLDISEDEIAFFHAFVLERPDLVATMRLHYQHNGKRRLPGLSLFDVESRIVEIGFDKPSDVVARDLVATSDNLLSLVLGAGLAPDSLMSRFDESHIVARLKPHSQFALRKSIVEGLHSLPNEHWVNFAGFLSARTGMGESARANLTLLRASADHVAVRTLPSRDSSEMMQRNGMQFGVHVPYARTTITVANADTADILQTILPQDFWGDRNIGYWVWETECLPLHFQTATRYFDEIWTPSAYSASAIRAITQKPVRVVPHTVSFAEIAAAVSDRGLWGLPTDKTLFGFFFDPKSVLERKNVNGLIDAFLSAVRPDDNAMLVLKSNERAFYSLDYEMIKARARSHPERILFMEAFLDRHETLSLMKSLDAYVSLHRSEGFGLTCAEAMACGIPVVASGYSGNLEFMDNGNSLLVDTPVIATERPYGPYPAGSRWGNPDCDSAIAAIRSLLSEDLRKALGKAGLVSIKKKLSLKACSSIFKSSLENNAM